MKKEELIGIIQERIKTDDEKGYQGFDMSGYNNSTYSNLELISKFGDLLNLNCDAENRQGNMHIPMFWKGAGKIILLTKDDDKKEIEDVAGKTTHDILFKIITLQNPKLLSE